MSTSHQPDSASRTAPPKLPHEIGDHGHAVVTHGPPVAAPNHAQDHHHDGSDHAHGHGHAHGDHDHHHEQPKNLIEWVLAVFHLGKFAHTHDHGAMAGAIAETSARGIWAIKISFIGLMLTAAMQVAIVYVSGSVALWADTIHNFGDAATAIPLWIAFTLSRWPRTRRYTYGFNRAEDLAGVAVVGLILFSAVVAAYESIDRFIHPRQLEYLELVAAAAIIGFIGNEVVAIFRIRVGREIGSAALIADGLHARIDGFTSLAVLGGAIGVWLGFPLADPIIGLLISLAILRITWNAMKAMWYRMMDAVEPEVVDRVEQVATSVPGVRSVHNVRGRWVGHQLHVALDLEVDASLSIYEGHEINEEVQHALFHALPRLSEATVHLNPHAADQWQFHRLTQHHRCSHS